MTTGFLYDSRFLDHNAGHSHPERSERLIATMAWLEHRDWFEALVAVEPATVDPKWLETVHDGSYIARADEACRAGAPFLDVPDVGVSRSSSDVARLAAGGAIELADRIVAGDISNGFSLSRPPGHHAEHGMALGFCLFNNVAIAARYLQRAHGVDKVLILDFDVHHGNGTQHTFEEDPSVMYASLHQYPYYPGTGAASETGTGRGAGTIVNCPMAAGAGDAEYERAFMDRILPAVDDFAPEFVILSAGFDAHAADPLAQIRLSTECFGWMSKRVMEFADRHAGGRVLSMLEGGYNVDVLPKCVALHLETLANVRAG